MGLGDCLENLLGRSEGVYVFVGEKKAENRWLFHWVIYVERTDPRFFFWGGNYFVNYYFASSLSINQ